MAEYKVIQDIEAEDKLIGPLTLKQFIFACVALGSGFLGFLIASKTSPVALIPFLPFIIIPGILATPFGKDQPTDIWLAAKLRFLIKPRKRIWSQDGAKNLVNITAPKKVSRQLTKNLNQQEVKSRLQSLADIIDTRGWATKSEDINLYSMPILQELAESDRLIDTSSGSAKAVPDIDITAADDILDTQNNATAQQFESMIKASSASQRKAVIERMKKVAHAAKTQQRPAANYSQDAKEQTGAVAFKEQLIIPHQSETSGDKMSSEESLLAKQFKNQHQKAQKIAELINPHHKSVNPLNNLGNKINYQSVTPLKNPDIVNLANADLKVATIATLANRNNIASNNNEATANLH